MIRYEMAPDIESKLKRISRRLKMNYIDWIESRGCEVTAPPEKGS